MPDTQTPDALGGPGGQIFTFLSLESADVPAATVIQEASQETAGRMRIKVPFYIGDSVSKAQGFKEPILWPSSILPTMVQEMKAQIAEGKQPLTVYARHAHALSFDHMPVGGITDVMQEGRVGYAVLDIEPTRDGKDLQVLLKANPPKVNAVSLRAAPGRYNLELQKVNGTPHLVCDHMLPSGIDFAPDGPAQATYGFTQVLQEAPLVEAIEIPTEEDSRVTEAITLETVRANTSIVQAIEQPLRDEIASLTSARTALEGEKATLAQENATLKQEKAKAEFDAYIERVSANMTQEQKKALVDFAATCSTKEEVAVAVTEILLLEGAKTPAAQPPDVKLALRNQLFPNSGGGVVVPPTTTAIVQEDVDVMSMLPS